MDGLKSNLNSVGFPLKWSSKKYEKSRNWGKVAMGQHPNRILSEHPNPHQNRRKWVMHLSQNGIPLVLTHIQMSFWSVAENPRLMSEAHDALHDAASEQHGPADHGNHQQHAHVIPRGHVHVHHGVLPRKWISGGGSNPQTNPSHQVEGS